MIASQKKKDPQKKLGWYPLLSHPLIITHKAERYILYLLSTSLHPSPVVALCFPLLALRHRSPPTVLYYYLKENRRPLEVIAKVQRAPVCLGSVDLLKERDRIMLLYFCLRQSEAYCEL